jgi:HSP20 family protein
VFDFGRVLDLHQEMERYLQQIGRGKRPIAVFSRNVWQPEVDVYETSEAVVALIAIPGVSQEEIHLEVGRDALTIRGERRPGEGQRTYTCIEIPFGPFERTIPLSSPVDPEQASASYNHGFLEVVMPRLVPAGPRRVAVRES